jgi:hypothetical protein
MRGRRGTSSSTVSPRLPADHARVCRGGLWQKPSFCIRLARSTGVLLHHAFLVPMSWVLRPLTG